MASRKEWNAWSAAEDAELVRLYALGVPVSEIAERMGRTVSACYNRARFVLTDGEKRHKREYTAEVDDFIRRRINRARNYIELTRWINDEFGTTFSKESVANHCARRGLHVGRKSHSAELLDVRVFCGREYVRVGNPQVPSSSRGYVGWERRSVFEWQRLNGMCLPDGYVVRHANGDKTDYSKENLVPMRMSDHARLNTLARFHDIEASDGESMRALVGITRLTAAAEGKEVCTERML